MHNDKKNVDQEPKPDGLEETISNPANRERRTRREIMDLARRRVLPPVGSQLRIEDRVYRVTYHNPGKKRFSAVFLGRVRQSGITGPDGQPLQRLEKPPEG
jgi:hypothetical protein